MHVYDRLNPVIICIHCISIISLSNYHIINIMKRILMLTGLCALMCYTSCKTKEEENKEEPTKLLVTSPY